MKPIAVVACVLMLVLVPAFAEKYKCGASDLEVNINNYKSKDMLLWGKHPSGMKDSLVIMVWDKDVLVPNDEAVKTIWQAEFQANTKRAFLFRYQSTGNFGAILAKCTTDSDAVLQRLYYRFPGGAYNDTVICTPFA